MRLVLPATLRLGPAELVVSDLERSVTWYEEALGLRVRTRGDGSAALGAGGDEDLLVLHEDRAARPAGRHAGIFHYALLFPSREDLARAVLRLAATRTPITGASDHGVSEAIYLRDPDGIGVELYRDLPRDQWPPPQRPGERVGMYTEPLDVQDLLATVAGEEARTENDAGVVMGHVHLHVGDVDRGLAFYRDVVGFGLIGTYPGAAFVAAGDYHHHVAFNVWQGEGVPPQPEHVTGLRNWTIVLDDDADVAAARDRLAAVGAVVGDDDERVVARDPWHIPFVITTDKERV